MSKAEKRALEKYPAYKSVFDKYEKQRYAYICGYIQAEKDSELTWEDVHAIAIIEDKLIHELCLDDQTLPQTQEFYTEVLKRFNAMKGGETS